MENVIFIEPGFVFGEMNALFNYAKANNFAIPAVNVVGTNSINSVLEAAAQAKSRNNSVFEWRRTVFAVNLCRMMDIRQVLWVQLQVPNIFTRLPKCMVFPLLFIQIMPQKLLPWIDAMLDAGEKFYAQ